MGRPPLCYEAKRSKGDVTAIIIIKTEDVFLILFAGFAVKVRCLASIAIIRSDGFFIHIH